MANSDSDRNGEGTYVFKLGDKMMKKAQSELSEKDKWRARDIEALREKVKAHKGLYCPTDDAFILRFLRARKFDYDRAYEMVCNYYTIRAQNRQIFDTLTPSAVKHVLDRGVSFVLPEPDKEGRRIILFRPGNWDPEVFPIYDILKTNVMNIEAILQDDEAAQINGVCLIGDMSGLGLIHAKHFERNYGKLTAAVLQDAMPMRFKGMHAVKEPTIIGAVFAIIKPFLKEKTLKRIYFHGTNQKELHKQFGKECLPEEFGGLQPNGDVLAEQWKNQLLAKEEFFQNMLKYKIEIDRTISNTKSDEIVNCMVGTYKKLNIE